MMFHSLDEALQEFDERFYYRVRERQLRDLKDFLRQVWDSAIEQGEIEYNCEINRNEVIDECIASISRINLGQDDIIFRSETMPSLIKEIIAEIKGEHSKL